MKRHSFGWLLAGLLTLLGSSFAWAVEADQYCYNVSTNGWVPCTAAGTPLPVTGNLSVDLGCAGQTTANTLTAPINNAASAANLKIITKVAAKNIYICAIHVIAGAATNVALVQGTLTTNQCDTATVGLAGGATAATGWNLAVNGGMVIGSGTGVIAKTTVANTDVCLLFSAANQVSGSVTYAQF